MVNISKADAELVISTWTTLPLTMIDLGERVMYKLFEKYPYNQQEFKKFRNVELDDLKGKPSFRVHASRIINRFDATVDCLKQELSNLNADEANKELEDIWRDIGESHEKRKITRRSFLVRFKLILIRISFMYSFCFNNNHLNRHSFDS